MSTSRRKDSGDLPEHWRLGGQVGVDLPSLWAMTLVRALTALVVVPIVAAAVVWLSGADLATGAPRVYPVAHPSMRGVVTLKAVAAVPFGSPSSRLREWAGPPDFTSPPLHSYPVPGHGKDVVVWGYECTGANHHACHTLFGFRNNRLATFCTGSPLFATPGGAHPGMTIAEARRLEPRVKWSNQPSWRGKRIPSFIFTKAGGHMFGLFVSPGTKPAFPPNC